MKGKASNREKGADRNSRTITSNESRQTHFHNEHIKAFVIYMKGSSIHYIRQSQLASSRLPHKSNEIKVKINLTMEIFVCLLSLPFQVRFSNSSLI